MDVPKFSGVYPESWIFAIIEYFSLLNTPADQWLKIVGFNLEGAVAEWFQWMTRNGLITTLAAEFLVSRPTTLGDAFSLALITEARLNDQAAPVAAIDQVENEIQEAVNKIQLVDQPSIDHESVFTDLKQKLEMIWPQEQLEESRNEIHESCTKYQEILGKLFDNDVSKAYADVDFDYKTINQIIISSLYHDGRFHIADVFLQESQVTDNVSLRTQFTRMRYIIKALRARELEPALTGVLVNREKINRNGSKLVFDLHRFQYLEIVQKGNKSDAMNYFNVHLKPFSSNRSTEVMKLMGSLLWCGKLETSPYSKLLSPDKWDDLVKELTKQFCNLMGVSLKNPLSVTLEAGAQALPTLLKDGAMEIELGNECSEANPPDTVFLNVGFESLVNGEVELCKLDSIRLAIRLGRGLVDVFVHKLLELILKVL
uniref:Protein RMD5 homolog A n=1 Tax=Tanacetum cinerariifolium TaxID=118510 RepID=A0A6L2K3D2_TANCI|nr:protein RMD5 homolog A [Tanacetum cinerariifolium]